MQNLTDELGTAKERRLNQFGTAVLVWCGKSVKFDRVCRTFVELNLGSTHGTPSESDVAPVSLQSRTYSVKSSEPGLRILCIGSFYAMTNTNARSMSTCDPHSSSSFHVILAQLPLIAPARSSAWKNHWYATQ